MKSKNLPFLITLLIIALLGMVMVMLVKQTQQVQVPQTIDVGAAPEASLSLSPASATISPGDSLTVSIVMDIQEAYFSNADILITFPNNLGVTPANFTPDPALFTSAGGWTFPTATTVIENYTPTTHAVKFSLINNTFEGAAPGQYTLGSFELVADASTSQRLLPVAFDPTATVVMDKEGLLSTNPSLSGGNYLVGTAAPTSTPSPSPSTVPPTTTPTQIPPTPTRTPTSTPPIPSITPTRTPTPIPPSVTPLPTSTPSPTPTTAPTPAAVRTRVRLQGILAATTTHPFDITITRVDPSGTRTDVFTQTNLTASSDSSGIFELQTPFVIPNLTVDYTYDILIKSRSHLQKRLTGTNLTSVNNIPTLDASTRELLAGDVNGDNRITVVDIGRILARYTGFRVPVTAGTPEDINSDGFMTLTDIALATLNYQDFVIVGEE